MRVGWSPHKGRQVEPPASMTVAVLNHIPWLEEYYVQSLEVLELCLASIRATADRPFDLLVFDNGS